MFRESSINYSDLCKLEGEGRALIFYKDNRYSDVVGIHIGNHWRQSYAHYELNLKELKELHKSIGDFLQEQKIELS